MSEPVTPGQNFGSSPADNQPAPMGLDKADQGKVNQGQTPPYNPYAVPVGPGPRKAKDWREQNHLSTYFGLAALVSCLLGFFVFFIFLFVPVFGLLAIVFATKEKKQGHNSTLGLILGWVITAVFTSFFFGFVILLMALSTI